MARWRCQRGPGSDQGRGDGGPTGPSPEGYDDHPAQIQPLKKALLERAAGAFNAAFLSNHRTAREIFYHLEFLLTSRQSHFCVPAMKKGEITEAKELSEKIGQILFSRIVI